MIAHPIDRFLCHEQTMARADPMPIPFSATDCVDTETNAKQRDVVMALPIVLHKSSSSTTFLLPNIVSAEVCFKYR